MLCNDYDVIIAGERLENGARLELISDPLGEMYGRVVV